LGAVLFYLLEGIPLYNSRYPHEIIKMHINNPIPKIARQVSQEIEEFIYKMLSKDPLLRPDAVEVVNKMELFIKKES
jgi:serine/threonine protein kinase